MFDLSILAKSVVGVGAAIATIWGGMVTLDSRYEIKESHTVEHRVIQTGMDNFSYTILKKEIREIREEIQHAVDVAHLERLQMDLEDAIDRLCLQFPQDRECR